MAGRKTNAPLTFTLSTAERKAIETLAGGRGARDYRGACAAEIFGSISSPATPLS